MIILLWDIIDVPYRLRLGLEVVDPGGDGAAVAKRACEQRDRATADALLHLRQRDRHRKRAAAGIHVKST